VNIRSKHNYTDVYISHDVDYKLNRGYKLFVIYSFSNKPSIKYVNDKYKDINGLINDIDIAFNIIHFYACITYLKFISPELKDYNNPQHFKLLCCAVKKHDTLFKHYKKYKFTNQQYIELINNNQSILNQLNVNVLHNILPYIKLNDKLIFKITQTELDIIIDNNDITDKKFIKFIIAYINKNIKLKEYIINILKTKSNNKLFMKCYNILEPYLGIIPDILNNTKSIPNIDKNLYNYNIKYVKTLLKTTS
jgi:hypothetical protein